uniref:U6 snRNA-associated Sm-like protein LSm1 n=1 Tax=Talaromyces marneffei PM1 TaxID=1077442 RepID=A0A093URW8_TALMA
MPVPSLSAGGSQSSISGNSSAASQASSTEMKPRVNVINILETGSTGNLVASPPARLASAPSASQAVYRCLFYILPCDHQSDNIETWKTHVLSHFRGTRLPPTAPCQWCPLEFRHPNNSNTNINNNNNNNNNAHQTWDAMLTHVAHDHFEKGHTLAASRPNFELMKYMYNSKIITEDQLKAIQLCPSPDSPAYHPSQDPVRASIALSLGLVMSEDEECKETNRTNTPAFPFAGLTRGSPRQQGQNQQAGPPPVPQGPPQLPPQMFTTAAQLLDLTDKKLVLVLRDGRKLIGVLRSWDQFGMLFKLSPSGDTVERIYAGNLYAEEHVGLYLVRGENVLLLGEIDLDKEDDLPETLTQTSMKEVRELKAKEEEERKKKDKKSVGKLQTHGFEPEHSGERIRRRHVATSEERPEDKLTGWFGRVANATWIWRSSSLSASIHANDMIISSSLFVFVKSDDDDGGGGGGGDYRSAKTCVSIAVKIIIGLRI